VHVVRANDSERLEEPQLRLEFPTVLLASSLRYKYLYLAAVTDIPMASQLRDAIQEFPQSRTTLWQAARHLTKTSQRRHYPHNRHVAHCSNKRAKALASLCEGLVRPFGRHARTGNQQWTRLDLQREVSFRPPEQRPVRPMH
jgi:hypothetical protein